MQPYEMKIKIVHTSNTMAFSVFVHHGMNEILSIHIFPSA